MDRHLPKCYYDTEFMDISFYSRLWCIMLYLFFFIFEIYDTSTTTEAKLSISTTTEATVDFNHMFVLISIISLFWSSEGCCSLCRPTYDLVASDDECAMEMRETTSSSSCNDEDEYWT